jgi:hypothetical protein
VTTDDRLGARQPERESLLGFRDWYAEVIVKKIDGLSLEAAATVMTPSGLSPLGIVKHLGWAERLWYLYRFRGDDFDIGITPGDNSPTFVVTADDTVETVIDSYRAAVAEARVVIDGANLDDVAAREHQLYGFTSLRWILVHMLEETARHAGHLDILREQLDGHTGD